MNRLHSIKRWRQQALFLLLALAIAILAACSGGGEEDGGNETLENIAVATPTSAPTATPIPTATEFIPPTATPENGSGSILAEVGISEEPTEDPNPEPTVAIPLIEPQVVSINFRQAILNDWISLQQPPPGWVISEGLDGILLTQDPASLPGDAFILVRRWGNVVNLSDWVAYLPDGFEERDSNVTIRMGGFDWDGVFITTEDNRYRAFFAVSNEGIPAYTLLVYVPLSDDQVVAGEGAGTEGLPPTSREAILAVWDLTVGDMNQILRRFIFS